jgi:collagen type III alpha
MSNTPDAATLIKAFATVVKDHVAKAFGILKDRIAVLEKQLADLPVPKDGRDGVNGKDGTPGAAGERGIAGEKGEPGANGQRGEKGDPGERGERGETGPAGERGEKGDAGEPGPKGEPGQPGSSGERGEKGERGIDGKDGAAGVDGKSVTLEQVRQMWFDMYSKEQAGWALDFERRAQDLLHQFMSRIEKPANGKDGVDGIDGRDGLGIDDLDVQYDGERSFTFVYAHGDRRKEFVFKAPVLLERGVHKQGEVYERGDGVTYQGSFWIAQRDTSSKPGEDDSWRLAVKKGRDGRDAERVSGAAR